jgi:quinol monooxygenase YgiN
MAIAVLIDFPGGSQEEYDAVARELGPVGESVAGVPGLLFHAAGPTADGWRVIDCWESQEALDRFRQEQLMPAMQRVGGTRRPSVRVMPVHQYLK